MDLKVSFLNLEFVLIIALLAAMRAVWPRNRLGLFLAVSGCAIVGFAAPMTLVVIAGTTVLYIFPLHRLMRRIKHHAGAKFAYNMCLAVGIAGLVGGLLLFKLERQFTVPWLGGPGMQARLVALIGFSYFIFRSIDFLRMQAILPIDERTPWPLLSYTLFLPTLSSGPIQRYQDFRLQLDTPQPLTTSLVFAAGYRITRGYFRKAVVAVALYGAVSTLLAQGSFTFLTSVLITALLYFYFYFDFAGYSDIAIGFGLLMGIQVPENFRKPFLATTVSEFWRNWHITLVDWFRNHVFIPLGGMASNRVRAAAVALLIMILCGFWHGLTVPFLVWGAWHGLVLFVEALSGSKPIPPGLRHGARYWTKVLWTNARVAFGCVLFLPSSAAMLKVLHGFLSW